MIVSRTPRTRLLTPIFLLMMLSVPATAKVVYVDADATGANNGSSWADAYNYLQDALADANSSEKPVEIRVAQGIYRPDEDALHPDGTGDREATFQLINGVILKGGYAGFDELDPDARDITLYETILSGDLFGNDADVNEAADLEDEPSRADNSWHVLTGSGTDETAVLESFAITSGYAMSAPAQRDGAGLYNESGHPTITDCRFRQHAAFAGGAIFNLYGNLTLTNCNFENNFANREGGAVLNVSSSATLTDCTFCGNVADSWGGAICSLSNATVTLSNCVFTKNTAYMWGGAMENMSAHTSLTDCAFLDNCARAGGAISYSGHYEAHLDHCSFTGNRATELGGWGGASGGAISNAGAALSVEQCRFSENSASRRGGAINNTFQGELSVTECTLTSNCAETGGAIYNEQTLTARDSHFEQNTALGPEMPFFEGGGGAICNRLSAKAIVASCTFEKNAAPSGGAILSSQSCELTLEGGFFYDNAATSGSGGAVCNDGSALSLRKCCFAGNSTPKNGGALYSESVSVLTPVNCVFTGNKADQGGGIYLVLYTSFSRGPYTATITNCTFASNWATAGSALNCTLGAFNFPLEVTNCIFWDEPDAIWVNDISKIRTAYNDFEDGWPGLGNIDVDPCFAAPGYWADANDPTVIVEPEDANAMWILGDYHLKSQAGRWDSTSTSWVRDETSSPCVDAGAPQSPIGYEPFPNGGYLNMGAYGGTTEASKSYFGEPVCETIIAGDINGDCRVDLLDLARMASNWIVPEPLTLNQAPIVTIIEPQDGDDIYFHDTTTRITVRAEATGIGAPLVAVGFIAYYSSEGHHRGTGTTDYDGSDGWQFNWRWRDANPLPEGEYTITASALDEEGNFGVSQPVVVTVHGPP